MLIIALLVPGRWDWTFGASSRDIEVSYNLLSPPLFSLPLFPKNTLAWSWFFYFFISSPFPPPYTYPHTLYTAFSAGAGKDKGLSLFSFFQAYPPSAAKHHIQEERGEQDRQKEKEMTRLISLGAIARIHPHASDISI